MSTGFPELLDLLGYTSDAPITVCHKPVNGVFKATWTTAAAAPAVVERFTDTSDVWFNVNGLHPRNEGRGRVQDVVRLAALWADLDVKPGGMPTEAAAVEVIRALADMLGTMPTAAVFSGHGYQPYWALDPDDPATKVTDDNRGDVIASVERFGRLVAHVAELHGGAADSVFDLARVLRVPGTWNRKADLVKVVLTVCDDSRPLTVSEVEETLETYLPVEKTARSFSQSDSQRRPAGTAGKGTPHRRFLGLLTTLANQPAVPNGRNNLLNWCAYRTGEMLAAGDITDPRLAAEALAAVARDIGLDRDPGCGEHGIRATIRSGFRASGVHV